MDRPEWTACHGRGAAAEGRVIHFLSSRGYLIEPCHNQDEVVRRNNGREDKLPADIRITGHVNGGAKPLVGHTLEIKADAKSHETGNACLEVLSNVGSGRLGWAYTTSADFVGHLSTGDGLLCIVPTSALRERLAAVWHRCRAANVPDGKFTSLVLLVPMEEMKKDALWSGHIP